MHGHREVTVLLSHLSGSPEALFEIKVTFYIKQSELLTMLCFYGYIFI